MQHNCSRSGQTIEHLLKGCTCVGVVHTLEVVLWVPRAVMLHLWLLKTWKMLRLPEKESCLPVMGNRFLCYLSWGLEIWHFHRLFRHCLWVLLTITKSNIEVGMSHCRLPLQSKEVTHQRVLLVTKVCAAENSEEYAGCITSAELLLCFLV